MDDMTGGKEVATGQASRSSGAATQGSTFGKQPWPGGTVNGTVHTTTAEKTRIGRIHDRINVQAGDITPQDLYAIGDVSRVVPACLDGTLHTHDSISERGDGRYHPDSEADVRYRA